jgi:ABC-2 type transport system ATP-binding protein
MDSPSTTNSGNGQAAPQISQTPAPNAREKTVYDPTAQSAIAVDHIVKKYGDFTAVDNVSFDVKDGEIFGLLGPNGAGKSTLIRMMTTLIPITAGKAIIGGHDVSKDSDAARRMIGVIPQALTSDLDLTVDENLNIYAKLYDVPAKERKRSIDELLELVDLTKWRDAQTKTLSGGMRRRLEIARGLVHHPRIFFLDEPTTGLDPVSRVAVWEMLGNIKSQRQLTILITTHYMDEADRLCDRIAIVDHGKLVALDTPTALKTSVPGSNVIEAQFEHPPEDWEQRLHALSDVTSVQHEGAGMFRVLTGNGSRTTTALVEMAVEAGVPVKSLSVQNTTLDDVFVHYTGRQLRDELQKAYAFVMPQRPGLQP